MSFQELFSKLKEKKAKAGQPVIFVYDEIPEKLKNQIGHIWMDAIGSYGDYSVGKDVWDKIHNFVSRELGIPSLGPSRNQVENCYEFLFTQSVDNALDIIQASFNAIELYFAPYTGNPSLMERNIGLSCPPDYAIRELNQRFLENDVGYQYQNGKIIRIDSQYTYSEVILPALQLLNDAEFKPALNEFMKSHEHYRKGRYEDSLSEALKAFESVMKIIIAANKWTVAPDASAAKLIQVCFENGLVPSSLLSHFSGLRTTLESGLPTVRNKYAGHGDGTEVIEVPEYLAQYAINLAATNIVLLVSAYKNKGITNG